MICAIDNSRAEYFKNYYSSNKESLLAYKKAWRTKNKQLRAKYNQAYKENNPWVSHLEQARSRCNNPANPSYRYYGAKGRVCILTFNEIKQLWFRDKAWLLKEPSIDRINSKGHYTKENCRFIEMTENSQRRWEKTI